jgi:hypothetical protein
MMVKVGGHYVNPDLVQYLSEGDEADWELEILPITVIQFNDESRLYIRLAMDEVAYLLNDGQLPLPSKTTQRDTDHAKAHGWER